MSARVDFAYLRAVRSSAGPASPWARWVATAIALRSDGGSCFLTREELADETRLGIDRVRRAVRELVAAGWLVEHRGAGKPRFATAVPEAPVAAPKTRARQAVHGGNDRRAWRQRPEGSAPPMEATTIGVQRQRPEGMEATTGGLLLSGSTPKKPQEKTPTDLTREGASSGSQQEKPQKLPPRGATLALPGLEAAPTKPIDPLAAPEVTEVLEHWRSRGYHTRRPIDTPERRKRIADRLAEGLDVPTLKAAIDGASIDDWLMGRHERNHVERGGKVYNQVETILRDAAQVEKLATVWDVALAEGRAHPDGGDMHYDRFGQPRRRAQEPAPPAAEQPRELVGREEAERRFAAMAAEYEARKQAARDAEAKAEEERRAKLTPEVRAEEDMLLAIATRSQKRMAEQEAREEQKRAKGWN